MTLLLLLSAALALGLVTGLHCVGMCGPLALALPVVGTTRTRYVLGRILYNLGRACTYAVMGAVIGLVGRSFALGGFQRWVSITFGALLLLGILLMKTGLLNRIMEALGLFTLFARVQGLWRRHFSDRGFTGLFVLGLINGLLPCGPVYVALAAAAATGHIHTAALFMFVFGLGTLPMMLTVSLAGKLIQMPMRRRLQKLVPISAAVVAILLIMRGLALGIPYLSPPLEATTLDAPPGACCGTQVD
ncbi:MAG TPA: sulfite exporter TauE/SafE family protein [Kiritimatiellia bacterium]|nr:sulfite exporter TauE/SafE family protein [Kiritimatiellia bacterium]